MYLELCVSLICIVIVVAWLVEYNAFHRAVNKIPGPKPLPFLGNIKECVKSGGPDFLPMLLENATCFYNEGIFRLWLGPSKVMMFCYKPETAEVLLSSTRYLEKAEALDLLHPWLGTGLLTSHGEKWKSRRKLLTPAFHFKILTSFSKVFNQQAKVLVEQLSETADGDKVVDIFPYITLCTLDIICDTAMGRKLECQKNKDSPYVKDIVTLAEITLRRAFTVWLQPDILFYNLPIGQQYRQCLNVLHDFTDKVIEEKKSELASSTTSDMELLATKLNRDGDEIFKSRKQLALLDLLLYMRKTENVDINDEGIREEIDTFMFEGHDTTASGVSWTLYLISLHQDVQSRLHEEVDSVIGSSDGDITMDNLKELKFLECVIKETLRIFPPVPFYGRRIFEPCKIGDYIIPAGVDVLVFTNALHRRTESFTNPEKFDPDRWAHDKLKDRHPYSYVPFSAGPRNCIGQKFAMNEEKILLATLLRHFSFTSTQKCSELRLLSNLILRPEDGILLKISKRKT